jgi:hypothetical protein
MTAPILRLEDGVDTIDFINDSGSTYYLLDGTLEFPAPSISEERIESSYRMTSRLASVNLDDREISFSIRIQATTQTLIMDALNKLYRMIARASNRRGLAGGSFAKSSGWNSSTVTAAGTVTGDQGLRLVVRYGEVGAAAITNEIAEATTDPRTYTFKVLRGDVIPENVYSTEGTSMETSRKRMNHVNVTLTCQPLALGVPRRVSSVSSLRSLVYPDTGASAAWTNRIVIPAASVPGTHDALVRLTTAMDDTMLGLLVGRDAGPSLLNCPSAPTGTAAAGVVPVGMLESSIPHYYEVNVVSVAGVSGNPTVRWRKINGSTGVAGSYSSNTVIDTAYETIMIDGTDIGFYTTNANWGVSGLDVAAGSTATFRGNQASFHYTSSNIYNPYVNRVAYMSSSGYAIGSQLFLTQPGVTGKYKIMIDLFQSTGPHAYEIKAIISDPGEGAIIGETAWIPRPVGATTWLADIGTLDLTPTGTPGSLHTGANMFVLVQFYIRGVETPPSTALIEKTRVLLVPCADEYAYLRVGWESGNYEMQAFSNFEAMASYFVHLTRDTRSGADYPNNVAYLMDETHEGQMITLIPGVTNTLLIHGLFSGTSIRDYRRKSADAGSLSTGKVEVAIRPRYMFVG